MRLRLPRKIRVNLTWKILIALLFVVLVFIPLGAYLFISRSVEILNTEAIAKAKILKDNQVNKGVAMTRNIALNISGAVAGSDFTFLQNIISQTAASDKEIRLAIIVNNEGLAMVHSDPLKALRQLGSSQDLKSQVVNKLEVFEYVLDGEDILEVAIPIMFGFERWGTLRVGYTLQKLKEEIRQTQLRQKDEMRDLVQRATIIAAICILVAIVLAILFSRNIVMAIRSIMDVTLRVAHGDFSQRVEVSTGDEIETLADAVNVMTQNLDNLTQEVFQKARMENELQTAELVQKNIMPKKDPKFPTIEFSSYFRSASETGGDWYAYSLPGEEEVLSVIIADVTGHGLPAALLTEAAYSCLQTMNTMQLNLGPTETLNKLNQVLIPQMGEQFGMTAFISSIHLPSLTMRFANAGHNMPLLYSGTNGKFGVLPARGPRLGDSLSDNFEEKTMQLAADMMVFWYTDGVLDCINGQGEAYGKKRLLSVLADSHEQSSSRIRDALVDDIMRYSGGARPPDDITFVVAKVLG
jgi:sigma-B regulation protein RsbU (phosphoserine phosphatase)